MAAIKYYIDENLPRALADELKKREIEVLFAHDEGMRGKDDDTEHLPFATKKQAVLVTQDHPFAGRTQSRTDHAGLICWTGRYNDIGGLVRALTQFFEDYDSELVEGQVFWLR